jgi:hypothetical protein
MATTIDPTELLERAAILEAAAGLSRVDADRRAAELLATQRQQPSRLRCACRLCVAAGRSSVLG